MKKLSDYYPIQNIYDGNIDTIFKVLSTIVSEQPVYPLVKDFINLTNQENLDIDYYIGHSADKYVSPLFEKLYGADDDLASITEYIADICYRRFGEKWKHIYDALMTEYNPLENYSMEEVRTPDLEVGETENEKSDIKTSRETSATNSYKGFNADDPVTINKTDGQEDVETSGAKLDNEKTKTTTHTGTETLTRAGNIGVTTSQQMLESEFKVRQYDFYKMIYNDIDSVLCLSIY